MAIANKMFNGIAGESDYIISDISIDVLEPQGVWTDTPANDPYFGGDEGFAQVFDMVERASEGLLQEICRARAGG